MLVVLLCCIMKILQFSTGKPLAIAEKLPRGKRRRRFVKKRGKVEEISHFNTNNDNNTNFDNFSSIEQSQNSIMSANLGLLGCFRALYVRKSLVWEIIKKKNKTEKSTKDSNLLLFLNERECQWSSRQLISTNSVELRHFRALYSGKNLKEWEDCKKTQ